MTDRRVDLLPASMLVPLPLWLRILPPNPAPVCPLCGAVPFYAGELGGQFEFSCSQCAERYWTWK